jgi:hypothetical protein
MGTIRIVIILYLTKLRNPRCSPGNLPQAPAVIMQSQGFVDWILWEENNPNTRLYRVPHGLECFWSHTTSVALHKAQFINVCYQPCPQRHQNLQPLRMKFSTKAHWIAWSQWILASFNFYPPDSSPIPTYLMSSLQKQWLTKAMSSLKSKL